MTAVVATAVSSDPAGGLLQIPCNGPDSQAESWLWGHMRWSGVIIGPEGDTDSQMGPNKLLWVDAADVQGLNVSGLYTLTVTGGAQLKTTTNTASRSGIHSRIVAIGQVGATPTLGVGITNIPFVSSLSTGYATASQGGLGGWTTGQNPALGYYRGSMFGGNDNVWLQGQATNYFMLVGREIDVWVQGSATLYSRIGLLINSFPSARQADGDADTAIMIVSQDNTAHNFKNGIMFGSTGNYANFTGALIKTTSRTIGGSAPLTVPVGIDFADATFGQAAFKSPGFSVDGAGNVAVGRAGFNGAAPIAKPVVAGSRSDGTALASLLSALAAYGLITDATTP